MFKSLTNNLTKIFDKIRSTGTLSQAQIDESMRDIRIALLEADVALPVIKLFYYKNSRILASLSTKLCNINICNINNKVIIYISKKLAYLCRMITA